MVTGANSGIGRAATEAFLAKGGTVHMVCRSRERAVRARDELLATTEAPSSRCHLHILDLSSVGQVKAFARQFSRGLPGKRLDALVNNAGCMRHAYEHTSEGNETNFATNTLGCFVLTEELLPALTSTSEAKGASNGTVSPSRVITVSSGGAYTQKLDAKDLQTSAGFTDGTYIYAQNKRQQVALTDVWARQAASNALGGARGRLASTSKLGTRPVAFSAMHPGWADTPALRTAMPDFHKKYKAMLRTPAEGADTIVWLASAAEALECPRGSFFLDRAPQEKHLWGAWTRPEKGAQELLYDNLSAIAAKVEPDDELMSRYAYMASESEWKKYESVAYGEAKEK